jgi:hypothetical protein
MNDFQNFTEKQLEALKGITLKVYCFLLQTSEPIGPRELQRALRLKSSSHAHYHLQKHLDLGFVEKTPQNEYILKDKYKVKSIKLNVLTDYVLIGGKFWPKLSFIVAFLSATVIIAVIAVITIGFKFAFYYLIGSTIVVLGYSFFEVVKLIRYLPWNIGKEE